MDKVLDLALVGASGVVGQKIIQLLEKKNFQINKFFPLGKSSVGEVISLLDQDYTIEDVDSFDASDANLVIFAAGSSNQHTSTATKFTSGYCGATAATASA